MHTTGMLVAFIVTVAVLVAVPAIWLAWWGLASMAMRSHQHHRLRVT